tara:strand:+ start:940 stop:1461 length:522 start_codon:yes stop_codon:yes gene_type:complete
VCLGAFYEWIKNNLANKALGLFVILNFGTCSIIFIVLEDGIISPYLLYLFVIINTAIFDTFAYIVGSNFGKTKIAKKTSPKKTYEGLFGGILFSGLYSYLICVIFNINFLIIVCFIIGSIFALIGDLFISHYKRKIGIKDTGKILPGHGGILDRIDSHLLATPVKVILISQIL